MSGSARTISPKNGKASNKRTAPRGGRKKGRRRDGAQEHPTWDLSRAGEVDAQRWDEWVDYLTKRSPVPTFLDGYKQPGESPLLWGLPPDAVDGHTRQLLADLVRFQRKLGNRDPAGSKSSPRSKSPKSKSPSRSQLKASVKKVLARLEPWLEEESSSPAAPGELIETLAWCHAAPALAQVLAPGVWLQLLERLLQSAASVSVPESEREEPESLLPHTVWTRQMLLGELPWTLATLLRELEVCQPVAEAARTTLSAGLVDWLDGEGLPHARQLPMLRPLLACWTRCRLLGRDGEQPLDEDAETQYEWLIRQSLRLSRPDGTMMFSDDDQPWQPALLRAALELNGDDEDLQVAEDLFLPAGRKGKKGKKGKSRGHRAGYGPAVHSNWSGVTVLRPALTTDSPWVAASYPGNHMSLELGVGKHTLLRGSVETYVAIDGEPIKWTGEFEELCWFSDEDVDYLELEIQGEGCRLQRQILLAREDHFLFFADALLTDQESELGYQVYLPLAEGTRFEPREQTREGQLVRSAPMANVLPLALPEWRCQPHPGHLRERHLEDGGRLELGQLLAGRRLYAPLLFDLKPQRLRKPLTWRQLTVGENLAIQPPDVACGFRVQAGKKQWLLYRSLAPCRNRTVLGQNLMDEFLCGRFDQDGDVEPLVKIETDEAG